LPYTNIFLGWSVVIYGLFSNYGQYTDGLDISGR